MKLLSLQKEFSVQRGLQNVQTTYIAKQTIRINTTTKILEANLFAFAYRLFHEDFSSINGTLHGCNVGCNVPSIEVKSS